MIFKDKKLQHELEENGFVVIPFLNEQELKELCQFYGNIHNHTDPPNFIENIHMTTWCSEDEYKREVSEGLSSIFKEASNRFFKNFRRLNHVFIVKKNLQDSTFKVHQDWSVVDEKKHESVNVWIPLHNVNETSGALWVLKASHKVNRHVRGSGYLFPDYTKFIKQLEKSAVSVKLNAGSAIVFYHSVIHGSPPNLSERNREAACFSVAPDVAPLRIYFQPKEGMNLEIHQPEDDFMYNYKDLRVESQSHPPTKKPLAVMPTYINKPVELDELDVFLKPKSNFFNRFKLKW